MVEKWDPVLEPQDPQDPRDSRGFRSPRTSGSSETPRLRDPQAPWDLRTPEPLANYLYRLNFRKPKRPETLKPKQKQKTSPNYIIGRSETKVENYVYLLMLFYLSSC